MLPAPGQAQANTDIRAAPGLNRSLARSTNQSTGAVAPHQFRTLTRSNQAEAFQDTGLQYTAIWMRKIQPIPFVSRVPHILTLLFPQNQPWRLMRAPLTKASCLTTIL